MNLKSDYDTPVTLAPKPIRANASKLIYFIVEDRRSVLHTPDLLVMVCPYPVQIPREYTGRMQYAPTRVP